MRIRGGLVLILLAALPAIALCLSDVPEGKWWKRPRLAEEIGLTRDQQDEIEKIFVRSRTKLIDLRADLEKKQLALQGAMEDKSAERRDVEKKIESLEMARSELQKARVLMIHDMKQVLKPEQWEKLLRRRDEIRERREEMRERFPERHQGQKPDHPRSNQRPQRKSN